MNSIIVSSLILVAFVNITMASPLWSQVFRSPQERRQLAESGLLVACSMDDDCEMGMFCDTHYGFCDQHRGEGEACRQDRHCKDRLICMFGKCQAISKPGHAGARCESSSDCRPELCCARTKGEKVCKPRLSLGEKCFVPQGGLDYVLNETCPCERGLACTAVSSKGANDLHETQNYDHLRCSLPKISLPF